MNSDNAWEASSFCVGGCGWLNVCANAQELQHVTCMGTSTCTDLHHKLYQGHWKKAPREMSKMALIVSRSLLPLVFPSSPLAYVNHSNASAASESSPLGYCYQHPRKQNRTSGEEGKALHIMGDVEGGRSMGFVPAAKVCLKTRPLTNKLDQGC